ncbi:unnamed protein product [Ectocarpus fasciculatus]
MDCGFNPRVAPVLLPHMVSTVFGEEVASGVATLSTADVGYMLDAFRNHVVCSYSREEIFFRMATRPGNVGITRDDLRPLIIGAVQDQQDFIVLSPAKQVLLVENTLTTIFASISPYGMMTLDDVFMSGLVGSLSAVGRLEIRLADSALFGWHFDGLTAGGADPQCLGY